MKYYYNRNLSFDYHLDHLDCKCGSYLILRKTQKGSIHIIKCSNDSCITNTTKLKRIIILEYFLPKDIFDNFLIKSTKTNKERSNLCIEFWLKRGFTEEESKKSIFEIQRQNSLKVKNRSGFGKTIYNINWVKNKYNVNDIHAQGIVNLNKRKYSSRCKEYWLHKGLTEDVAIEKIAQNQNKSKFIDYNNFYRPNQIGYWINKGYDQKEAEAKLSERQSTFTLEKCIKRYGEEEGTKKYNDRQEKWKKKVFNKDTCICQGVSNSSKKFIKVLLSNLNISLTENAQYGKSEKFITDKDGQHYKYDLAIGKKIIEYNGDFWHCNPNYFREDFIHPVMKITAKEIWDKDEKKINIAKYHGYEVLIIWESDYLKDPIKVIDQCIIFIKG